MDAHNYPFAVAALGANRSGECDYDSTSAMAVAGFWLDLGAQGLFSGWNASGKAYLVLGMTCIIPAGAFLLRNSGSALGTPRVDSECDVDRRRSHGQP